MLGMNIYRNWQFQDNGLNINDYQIGDYSPLMSLMNTTGGLTNHGEFNLTFNLSLAYSFF